MSNSNYTSPYAKKQLKKVKERNPEMYKKIMEREGLKENNTGGSLKEVPENNKGLGKLPTKVRNRMGYLNEGKRVKDAVKIGAGPKGGTRGTLEQAKRMYESEKQQMKEFQEHMKYIESQLSDNRGSKKSK